MERRILHIDMDAFFASVEQRDDPSLRGRPVVVGARPGGRGVVATCSYEARRYGLRSAMPINEAYRRCPQAVYLQPDMARYVAESRRVMAVLQGVSPVVERVSIDEAYVDVSGLEKLFGTPQQIAELTRRRIFEAVRLSASVGIGPNRLIAKLASDHNKPDGVTVVEAEQVMEFLAPMPVGNLRGIGARTLRKLEDLGVRSVADLRRCPQDLLIAHFGAAAAARLHAQSRGVASHAVGGGGPRKSISRETTFNEDLSDWEQLRAVLRELAADVARQVRAEGLSGRVVTLKIRFDGFETHTRQVTLAMPTNHDDLILRAALELASDPALRNRPVRLIGVGLSGWDGENERQLDLFQPEAGKRKDDKLYAALDQVRARFGQHSLRMGMKPPRSR